MQTPSAISTFKNCHGDWETSETHALADGSPWLLTITTSKVYSGAVVTNATVSEHSTSRGFLSRTHRMFTDYSKRLDSVKIRATEKSVPQQHRCAIIAAGGLDTILTAARAHLPEYTAQTAAV